MIKLTCYDFKVTQPLGIKERQSDDASASTPWWKIFCLCSLLPEDDPQTQIFRIEEEKRKSKHHRKGKEYPPGPVAEGLEDRLGPPSIMTNIGLDSRISVLVEWRDLLCLGGGTSSEQLSSVVIQSKTEYHSMPSASGAIKARRYARA